MLATKGLVASMRQVLHTMICVGATAFAVASCSSGPGSTTTAASPKKAPVSACNPFAPGDQANLFEDKALGISYVVPSGYKTAAALPGTSGTPPVPSVNPESVWSFNGAALGSSVEVEVQKLHEADPFVGAPAAKRNEQNVDNLLQHLKAQRDGGDESVVLVEQKSWGSEDCPAVDMLFSHTPETQDEAEHSVGVNWSKKYFALFGKGDNRWMVSAFDKPEGNPDPSPTAAAQQLARSLRTL